ncbi:MAG TPA: hypothetical protein VFM22_07510 [Castellaniella sp.]|jgi:hypothetical protein|nr:hypothetical protein [Castellaniella sp.]
MRGGPRDRPDWQPASQPLRLVAARTFRQRLAGLHAWQAWGDAPWGLLLPGCRAVHTFGLVRAIDLVFLGAPGEVAAARPGLAPGRVAVCGFARAALELPKGYCRRDGWREAVCRAWADYADASRKIVA